MRFHQRLLFAAIPIACFLPGCGGAASPDDSQTSNATAAGDPSFDACLAALPAKPLTVSGFTLQFTPPDYETVVTGADGSFHDLGAQRLVASAGAPLTLKFFRFFKDSEGQKIPDGLKLSAIMLQDDKEVFRQPIVDLGTTLVGITGTLTATLPETLRGRVELRFEEELPGQAPRVDDDFDGNAPQPPLVSSHGKPMFLEIAGKETTTLCLDRRFKTAASAPLTPGGSLVVAYDARRLLDQAAGEKIAVAPRVHVTFFDASGRVTSELRPNGGGQQDVNIGDASADAAALFLLPVTVPLDARSARVFVETLSPKGKLFDSNFGAGWPVDGK